jgi:hypothetical protein
MEVPVTVPSGPNVRLDSLASGDPFWDLSANPPVLYEKTDGTLNAMRLSDGHLQTIDGSYQVCPQGGKFVAL